MTENIKTKVAVSVIIVSYNTKELTKKALGALFDSSVLPEQVIVVDNNSADGSREMISSEFPAALLIASDKNLGFAKANNLAIKTLATEKYIWLLNSDTETGKNSLNELFAYMENNKNSGAIGPALVYPDQKHQSVGGYFPSPLNVLLYLIPLSIFIAKDVKKKIKSIALYPQRIPDSGIALDYVTGAAMFLRRKSLDEAGLLGEDYFMYFEETDLCWRLKKKGWEIRAINTDPVMHVYGGSYRSKFDQKRLFIFLESLRIFVDTNYSGMRKFLIRMEIRLFGHISVYLKSLRK